MTRRLSMFTPLCALLLAIACHESPTNPGLNEYRSALARWEQSRPAGNSYLIDQKVLCFCVWGATDYEVTVAAGVITRAVDKTTGRVLDPTEFGRFRTVDQLFAEVATAMQVDGKLRSVQYDTQRGYPSFVSLDPIIHAVDDEVVYQIVRLAAPGT